MRNTKQAFVCVAVVCAFFGATVGAALVLMQDELFSDVSALSDFSVGIVSLVVSVIALVIALITYLSIDSVGAISSMEGNVLTSEDYCVAYHRLVDEFKERESAASLKAAVLAELNRGFRENGNTCADYANNLQHVIDHLLWFAYFRNTEGHEADLEALLRSMEKGYAKLGAVSNANQYIFEEHLKLIGNVMRIRGGKATSHLPESGSYQVLFSAEGKMLNVRGEMFRNRISRTIYDNYLGLEYLEKASAFLGKEVGLGEEAGPHILFFPQNLKKLDALNLGPGKLMVFRAYIEQAEAAFDDAMKRAENDVLWRGYVSFNKACVAALRCVAGASDCQLQSTKAKSRLTCDSSWQESFKEAIEARGNVFALFCIDENGEALSDGSPIDYANIIGGTDGKKGSYLQRQLLKELFYVKSLYCCLKKYAGDSSPQPTTAALTAEEQEDARRMSAACQQLAREDEESIFAKTNEYLAAVV